MCGIAGIWWPSGHSEQKARETSARMAAALSHRGPDAEGHWVDGAAGIALGHRRLSIVDLSAAGSQPMLSASGRYVIAYNGEIYNHLDLRKKLEAQGKAPNWRGHSDTETLLAAIDAWGFSEALIACVGMFAIALWDRQERVLSLARDRMGEKPLYWGWAGTALVFGSELKALRKCEGFPSAVCPEALALYLRFAYVPVPRSIHPGVYKLEPGCILTVAHYPPTTPPKEPLRPGQSFGSLSIARYWSLNDTIEAGRRARFAGEAEALVELEAALEGAVRRQMIADVPLGAFLSGGIDSSLIVALMQKHSVRPVRTFTVGFENAAFNEAPHAAAVARHLGTEHYEITVTERDALDVIPLLPHMYDEPFADSSQIPTHLMCRAARSQLTVALTGDAGDELFGGYNRYFWGPRIWSKLDWAPFPLRRALAMAIFAVPVRMWDQIGQMAGGSFAENRVGDKAHKLASRLRSVKDLDGLYSSLVSEWPGEAMVLGVASDLSSILDDPLPPILANDPVSRMMAQDMRSYLPDDILCKVDRAAMSVSLETRVPFLDAEVIGISARLPARMKIRDGRGKWALRQILYRHVPRELIERPKAGFGIPAGDWLRGPLRSWAEDLLSPAALGNFGLIDPKPVRKAWEEHLSGHRDWTHRLWIILMLQEWCQRQRSAA